MSENLGVSGEWTYQFREELKKRKFRWNPPTRSWLAPTIEAKEKAIADLAHLEEKTPTITVHADAGWKQGLGRFAWLIRSSLPPYKVEGTFTEPCPSVIVAEARALLLGVKKSLEEFHPEKGTVFFLRSDNSACVQYLTKQDRKVPEIAEILTLLKDYRLNVKHVPAHGKTAGTAGWANGRVDSLSSLKGVTVIL